MPPTSLRDRLIAAVAAFDVQFRANMLPGSIPDKISAHLFDLLRQAVAATEISDDAEIIEVLSPETFRWERTDRRAADISNASKDAVRKALQIIAKEAARGSDPSDHRGTRIAEQHVWIRVFGPRPTDAGRHSEPGDYFRAVFTIDQPAVSAVDVNIRDSALPPLPAHFLGREHLLRSLVRNVVETGTTMIGLWGLPGSGKTVLAVEVARMLSRRFPDRQIVVDLTRAESPSDVFRSILARFTTSLPQTDDEESLRAAAYEALRGQRGALVLDNAHRFASPALAKFSAPPGWLFIITTRVQLPLTEARWFRVRGLSPAHARQLILVMTGQNSAPLGEPGGEESVVRSLVELRRHPIDAALVVAHLSGYLPGPLRHASLRLSMTPTQLWLQDVWSMAEDLTFLSAEDGSYAAALAELYDSLPPRTQGVLLRLALLGDSFDADTGVEVSHCRPNELAYLERTALLERSRDGDYTMPGMVRVYALWKLFRARSTLLESAVTYLDFIELVLARMPNHALAVRFRADSTELLRALRLATVIADGDAGSVACSSARRFLTFILERALTTHDSHRPTLIQSLVQDVGLSRRLARSGEVQCDRAAAAIFCVLGRAQKNRAYLQAAASIPEAAPVVKRAALSELLESCDSNDSLLTVARLQVEVSNHLTDDPVRQLQLLTRAMRSLVLLGRPATALRLARTTRKLRRVLAHPPLANIAAVSAAVQLVRGDWKSAIRYLRVAWKRDKHDEVIAIAALAHAAIGRNQTAFEILEHLPQDQSMSSVALLARSLAWIVLCDPQRAFADATEILSRDYSYDQETATVRALALLCGAHAHRSIGGRGEHEQEYANVLLSIQGSYLGKYIQRFLRHRFQESRELII